MDSSNMPQSIRGVLVLPKIINFKDYIITSISAASATGFVILIVSVVYPPEYTLFILPACIMLLGASILLSNEYVDIMIESKSISDAKDGEYVNASGEVVESGTVRQAPFTNDEGCIIAWQVEEEFDNSRTEGFTTVSQGIVSEKFQIDNGSNQIDVNLDDGVGKYSMHSIFDSPREDEDIDNISVEPGEEPPRQVRNFIEQKTNIEDVATEGKMIDVDLVYKDGRRWYNQYVFEEGDDIYIRGIYERDGFDEKIRNSNEDTYVIGCSKADYIEGLGKYIHWTFAPLVTASVIGILLLFSPDIAILICKILTVLSFPVSLYWLFDSLK